MNAETVSMSQPPALKTKHTAKPDGWYRRAANWLLRYQGTPKSVATGLAVGVFVALTPTVGIQMAVGGVIAHFLKGNRAIAVAAAWITNPLTMGPIFYFNYRIGLLFLPGDEKAGKEFIDAISVASITEPASWWQAVVLMAQELWGVAGVLWLGSLIVASVCAAIVYPVTYRIVAAERKRLETVRSRDSLPPASDTASP